MIQKVRRYIDRYDLLRQGDRVITGVSGGADSVCLLLCLSELREEYALSLRAVHVNHGLRGAEADADEAFTLQLCRSLDVPCAVYHEDVRSLAAEWHISEEEAGRRRRYEIFAQEASDGLIAVAHHSDDQIETVLHNIIRGTGLKGLAGMSPRSGNIIRPLLGVNRREIEEWLGQRGQEYCTDSTNLENDYTRNRLRNILIPQIEEINAGAGQHLLSLAAQAAEAEELLEEMAGQLWQRTEDGGAELSADELAGAHAAAAKTAARQAISAAAGSGKDISAVHVEAVYGLRDMQVGSSISLPYGLTARRGYEDIVISAQSDSEPEAEAITAVIRVFQYEKGMAIPEKKYTKWFDYDKIQSVPEWRTRRQGDVIALGGVGHKSVRSYMIDAKIPAARRDRMQLLADGDRIMWIPGYRISEDYKITASTVRVLEVTIDHMQER